MILIVSTDLEAAVVASFTGEDFDVDGASAPAGTAAGGLSTDLEAAVVAPFTGEDFDVDGASAPAGTAAGGLSDMDLCVVGGGIHRL